MASLLDEFNAMKIRVANALARNDQTALHEPIHIVWQNQERKRKLENPGQSTRVVLNLRTPEAYKEFNVEKERFFEIAVDPHIAIGFLIRAMHQVSDETLRKWLQDGAEHPDDAVPDWLKD